jgi:hypothetical protein
MVAGRAPAPLAIEAGDGAPKTRSTPYLRTKTPRFAVIGIDIGKNSFPAK